MKPAHNQSPLNPPHLHNAQIIAYLDGELPSAELDMVRAHLEKCWTCRSWVSVVQSSIDRFLETRKNLLPADSPFDESRVEQFRQRLARHAGESDAAASLADRFVDGLAVWRNRLSGAGSVVLQYPKAALATVLAVTLVVVMFTDAISTRVSADTVLLRAETYESTHAPGAGQVTRTAVLVERIDRRSGVARQLGTLTVMHDSTGPLAYVSARSVPGNAESQSSSTPAQATGALHAVLSNDPQDAQLAQYLTEQHWVPDVSVAGFRSLIATRANHDAAVRKDGHIFELHYPFATGHASGIAEAMLRVDSQDYSPKSISIIAAHENFDREYRFTRTASEVEPRSVALARLAPPPDVSIPPGRYATTTPPAQRPTPLSYLNSHATEQEVAVAEALHRADACLGEEVYLFPMSDGSLLVQGLVDTAARREAIRQSLRTVPGSLRIEVYVPRELKNGSELFDPPDQFDEKPAVSGGPSTTATLADLSSAKMPLYDRLYQQFSQPGTSADDTNKQVVIFSNEVVTLARQTFLHAWALKKLDREFSPPRTAALPAPALQKIEQIRQDHRRWISTLAQRQAEMLSRIAGSDLVASASEVGNGRQDSDTLLRLAQEQNDLVRSLFTTSAQPLETGEGLSRLLSVLHRMGV
ncbi:MAG: zf-HC2 domain-containing protein [Acidobacteriia bacterium]|nr:zf-HC2 domain-containing protein [Terriglobia bacterium]